jgi:hypothetical protein
MASDSWDIVVWLILRPPSLAPALCNHSHNFWHPLFSLLPAQMLAKGPFCGLSFLGLQPPMAPKAWITELNLQAPGLSFPEWSAQA